MEERTEAVIETRKDWIAPELKKIDVEEITSDDGFYAPDSTDMGPSS